MESQELKDYLNSEISSEQNIYKKFIKLIISSVEVIVNRLDNIEKQLKEGGKNTKTTRRKRKR